VLRAHLRPGRSQREFQIAGEVRSRRRELRAAQRSAKSVRADRAGELSSMVSEAASDTGISVGMV
jgi:hypothetical protein